MADHALNDILVVDDDPTLVDMVLAALREAGYPFCVAYDGESALMAIQTALPAMVLLDIHLPRLTGLDVIARLQRVGLSHVPIVFMTADSAAAAQLPPAAFALCLIKPFAINDLMACVNQIFSKAAS
jgi:two-component system OmpR family response regulator